MAYTTVKSVEDTPRLGKDRFMVFLGTPGGILVPVGYYGSRSRANAEAASIERAVAAIVRNDPSVARLVAAARDYMGRDEMDNWRKLQAALAAFEGKGE